MRKWEGTMRVSERRAFINNLVSKANDEALNNDPMQIGCFARTGGLMTFTKSDKDLFIKPQEVISRISISEICNPVDFQTELFQELASPAEVICPENDSRSDDIHEEEEDLILNGM